MEELTLEILDKALAKIKEHEPKPFDVVFLNSEDWRKCCDGVRTWTGIQTPFGNGAWLFSMRVIAIPEIPQDVMIMYSSPDHYKVIHHVRV